MKRVLVCSAVLLSLSAITFAQSAPPAKKPAQKTATQPASGIMLASDAAAKKSPYLGLPLSFEKNNGQTDARVKFVSRGPGYN